MDFNSLPLKGFKITSKYGHRHINIAGASTFHKGVDAISSCNCDDVFCVAPGHISLNYYNNIRGWVVVVNHNNGYSSLYQHLKVKSPLLIGSPVLAGQVIGIMGNSSSTLKINKHLHFELLHYGISIDPLPYLLNVKEDITATMNEEALREIIRQEVNKILTAKDSQTSPWAKEYWSKATQDKVTDGARPKGYATREQVIAMIYRAKED